MDEAFDRIENLFYNVVRAGLCPLTDVCPFFKASLKPVPHATATIDTNIGAYWKEQGYCFSEKKVRWRSINGTRKAPQGFSDY